MDVKRCNESIDRRLPVFNTWPYSGTFQCIVKLRFDLLGHRDIATVRGPIRTVIRGGPNGLFLRLLRLVLLIQQPRVHGHVVRRCSHSLDCWCNAHTFFSCSPLLPALLGVLSLLTALYGASWYDDGACDRGHISHFSSGAAPFALSRFLDWIFLRSKQDSGPFALWMALKGSTLTRA